MTIPSAGRPGEHHADPASVLPPGAYGTAWESEAMQPAGVRAPGRAPRDSGTNRATSTAPRLGVVRRELRRTRTIALCVVIGVFALMDLIYSPWVRAWMEEDPDTTAIWKVVLVLVLTLAGALHGLVVLPRARWPRVTLAIASASALVLPFSPVAALVVLSSHLTHRRLDRPVLACAVVAVATAVCTWRDLLGTTTWTSWMRVLLSNAPSDHAPAPVPWAGVVVLVGLTFGASIGIGQLRRARLEARAARDAADRARSVAEEARTAEMDARRERDDAVTTASRRAEREQVAREIHDGIGHRLSLLSLEAGALQLEARGDGRLEESAARLRSQAAEATQELRTLVGMLREPTPEPVVTLDHLQTVLDESADAGQLLSATVRIDDGAAAPATLTRAVHRITTEIMTNARKHAPRETLRLRVTGGPGTGIDVEAANRVPAPPEPDESGGPAGEPGLGPVGATGRGPGAAPGGAGLVGIVERAELLGGTARYGVDGDRFRVDVHLPWQDGDGSTSS
ncbi:sensor histidine kinase [Georgenia sp. Z1491]|uniref:sensor histidine kinase n=1 Tax=Georgenia sp. Z1491 TaxID=3416707 RepID=UPI003CFADFC8